MLCPSCGNDNRLTARFCDTCGQALPAPVPTPPDVKVPWVGIFHPWHGVWSEFHRGSTEADVQQWLGANSDFGGELNGPWYLGKVQSDEPCADGFRLTVLAWREIVRGPDRRVLGLREADNPGSIVITPLEAG